MKCVHPTSIIVMILYIWKIKCYIRFDDKEIYREDSLETKI
jgi:hypothetical protein